jgi:hypothetical protein
LNDRATTDKIILGKKYHVKTWLVAGYATLVTQDNLDPDQLSTSLIDWPTISRLYFIREKVLKSRPAHNCSYCGRACNNRNPVQLSTTTVSAGIVENHIAKDFALELDDC